MSQQTLSRVELEALRLAEVDCVGHYGPEHLGAWRDLRDRGLVRQASARHGWSRFYRITCAGRAVLASLGESS